MQPRMPGGEAVGGLMVSVGRMVMVLVVPASIACVSACGSSSSGTPAQPGVEADASTDAVSDARADGARPDAADAHGWPTDCVPETCATLGANCGTTPDGCGGKITCGDCSSGQTCGGGGPNVCGTSSCDAKSCAQVNASCGYASDGCAQAIDCGDCPAPSVCGGGGTANQCGCAPKSCAQLGANCGAVPDGCFGVVECGDCVAGQTCGGGGPNQCGAENPDASAADSCATHPPVANAFPASSSKMQVLAKPSVGYFDFIAAGMVQPYSQSNVAAQKGAINVYGTGAFIRMWISPCPGESPDSLPAACVTSKAGTSLTLYVSADGSLGCNVGSGSTVYLNVENLSDSQNVEVQGVFLSQ